MRRLRAWLVRLTGIVPSDRREREMAEELETHLQMHTEDNVRAGMTRAEARRQAVLKLGGIEATKEALRDRRRLPVLDHLARDARFAIGQLAKNPGFSATAIVVLALGMSASIAIFAFVDAALVKPLPFLDPSRLLGVYETADTCPRCNLSYQDFIDWKSMNVSFSSLEAYQRNGFILTTPSGAQPTRGANVSSGFFRTLGVKPVLGRDFDPSEDLPSAPPTALISYGAWQQRYGGTPDITGKAVTLDGVSRVIVGVLPREFSFVPTEPAEFWTPIDSTGSCEKRRSCHNLYGVGRLKEGVTLEAALTDTQSVAKRLETQYPDSNRSQGATVAPLGEVIVGPVRPILLLLLSGAGLLLLIAALNVAGLLFVRAEGRRREMAVRSAVGASSTRLVSQFVTEAVVLVAAGATIGLALAAWTMRLLAALIPAELAAGLPFLRDLGLNGRVLGLVGIIALTAVAVFSLAPALRLNASALTDGLAEGSRGSAGRAWRRVGPHLVVLELATAMVLLIGAALLGQSLYRLLHVELGLRPERLVTLQMSVMGPDYSKPEQQTALGRRVLSEVGSVPGVAAVGITTKLPLNNFNNTTWFRVMGHPFGGEHNEVPQRDVSAGYFSALGATFVSGRPFHEGEDTTKPPVVIINEALARQYFPGEEALGKQISYLSDPPVPMEIVGIVKDVREGSLESGPRGTIYRPLDQEPDTYFSVVARTSQPEKVVLPGVIAAIHRIDAGIVTGGEMTMTDLIGGSPSAWVRRSAAVLLGGFALMALVLSVVGLYGVIAYSVSQRTREIGVRMALGAERAAVYQLVLREAGRLSAIGITLGVLASLAATGLLRGLLFGVSSWDVPTLAAVAALLGISALLASYVPARRAASVNPVEALRAE
jgi:macrolide transport system ATP-binding/permease protein